MSGEGRRSFARKVPVPFRSQQEQKDALISNRVCSYARELVQKLQTSENTEDACSLMGLITVYGKQLREHMEFFQHLLLDIYKLLEDTSKENFRVVLLHLIELIASNGNLDSSTIAYYKKKALLPKSCEDAFNAALRFGEDIEFKLDSPVCSPQVQVICPSFPEGGDSNDLVDAVEEHSNQTHMSSPSKSRQEPCFVKQEVNNNIVDEDNLAEVFGECIQSALTKVSMGNSSVSKQTKEFVKAEEEKGTKDETRSQILPSSTGFDLQPNSYKDSETESFGARTSVSGISKGQKNNTGDVVKEQQKSMTMFEKVLKVKGDVLVHLSSHSELHLEEVYDFLNLHFCSSPASVNHDTQAVNGVASGLVTYTREFLLQCSASSLSKKLPFDWAEICGKFPEIWCSGRDAFSFDNYRQPHVRSLLKQESKFHGNNFRRTMSMPNPERSQANGCESSELSEDDVIV